ncbi:YceH family protein [Teredinibacter sp. KSP-S5-2]|uniref:YceH family protein n=1 Tax=Teredinibacter sp. KSP-S5-2 TaxID=3034506 RepID=UPI002934ED79|nr:YceH family protein [Teredinibacter sp. KSP-S5-2]WNO07654.1 YceH family protein [Teredinibacter sp. KSP-S5-2]
MELTLTQARVIGSLLEKEITTPDQYPLTLNSLTTACNQKTSREPVMSLTETDVQEVLDELNKKGLISEVVFGSRVPKYKHRFCNTEFSQLQLNKKELACICIMLLRGPQSTGELRTRTTRLYGFVDVSQVENTLEQLMQRDGDPLIVRLEKESGKRDFRYMHLLGDEESFNQYVSSQQEKQAVGTSVMSKNQYLERIESLEKEVAELKDEVAYLKQQWEELNS